jgi:hypothetical protein
MSTWCQTPVKSQALRRRLWLRDQGCCQGPYCTAKAAWSLAFDQCYLDQLQRGKADGQTDAAFRILCRRCYVLRAANRSVGRIAAALGDGLIGPDWRSLVW